MSTTSAQFRSDLDELAEEIPLAAQLIERAGKALAVDGLVPDHDLITTLATIRRRFSTLQALLLRAVEAEGLHTELTDTNTSLAVLQKTFASLEDHRLTRKENEQRITKARQVIKAGRLIECENDAKIVAAVSAGIDQLQSQLDAADLTKLPDVVPQLIEGQHALASLIRMTSWSDLLSDEEWTACHEQVLEEFGRPVATAVARGRMICPVEHASQLPFAPVDANDRLTSQT